MVHKHFASKHANLELKGMEEFRQYMVEIQEPVLDVRMQVLISCWLPEQMLAHFKDSSWPGLVVGPVGTSKSL